MAWVILGAVIALFVFMPNKQVMSQSLAFKFVRIAGQILITLLIVTAVTIVIYCYA